MSKTITELQKLMRIHSPAQVAVWLGYADPRPIQQWISRGKIPLAKQAKVIAFLNTKGSDHVRVIRRPKGTKKRTV